jgi:hypothetical protein
MGRETTQHHHHKMTNILATISLVVVTNWTTIGTYTPVSGYPREDVQQGVIQTNTVLYWAWKGATNCVVLETERGPVVGERRVPSAPGFNPFALQGTIITNWTMPLPQMFWNNRNEAVRLNESKAANDLRDYPNDRKFPPMPHSTMP